MAQCCSHFALVDGETGESPNTSISAFSPPYPPPSPFNVNGGSHFSRLSFVCPIFLDMPQSRQESRITSLHHASGARTQGRKSTALSHSRRCSQQSTRTPTITPLYVLLRLAQKRRRMTQHPVNRDDNDDLRLEFSIKRRPILPERFHDDVARAEAPPWCGW